MKVKISVLSIILMVLLSYGPVLADSFIEAEAGISCSTKLDSADIALAASAYKNIEAQTEDYIIGSVALKDYGETEDVHVYLASTGEMIAYYLKEEPVGKIIDWRHDKSGNLAGSKLEDAMQKICTAMSATLPAVKYYDFRYPDATDIKILVDEVSGGTDTFRFQIPSDHIIVHAECSNPVLQKTRWCDGTNSIALDDEILLTRGSCHIGWCDYESSRGEIADTALTPDEYHTFKVTATDGDCASYGAIILLYHIAP